MSSEFTASSPLIFVTQIFKPKESEAKVWPVFFAHKVKLKFTTAIRTRTAAVALITYQQTKTPRSPGRRFSPTVNTTEWRPRLAGETPNRADSTTQNCITSWIFNHPDDENREPTGVCCCCCLCVFRHKASISLRWRKDADRRCPSHSFNQQSPAHILNFGLDFPPARCQINIFARGGCLPRHCVRTHSRAALVAHDPNFLFARRPSNLKDLDRASQCECWWCWCVCVENVFADSDFACGASLVIWQLFASFRLIDISGASFGLFFVWMYCDRVQNVSQILLNTNCKGFLLWPLLNLIF